MANDEIRMIFRPNSSHLVFVLRSDFRFLHSELRPLFSSPAAPLDDRPNWRTTFYRTNGYGLLWNQVKLDTSEGRIRIIVARVGKRFYPTRDQRIGCRPPELCESADRPTNGNRPVKNRAKAACEAGRFVEMRESCQRLRGAGTDAVAK